MKTNLQTPIGQRRARAFSRTLNREIDASEQKSFKELLNRSIFHAPVIRFPCGKLPARTQDWRQTRTPAPWNSGTDEA
jgi:hypothetical protein